MAISKFIPPLFVGLTLFSACAGEVEQTKMAHNPAKEDDEDEDEDAPKASKDSGASDGGKGRDAGRDAGKARDAGAEEEDDPAQSQSGAKDAAVDSGPEMVDAGISGVSADGGLVPIVCSMGGEPPPAIGLKVREIALYQTVKVQLYKGGSWTTNTTLPVVAGKKTLLRVFVDAQTSYKAHAVRAVLKLQGAQASDELIDERSLMASSTDADAASSFSFQIDPAKIAADTQISVALQERDCAATGGVANDVRVPATGLHSLGAQAIGKLKVVIVPISVGGRLPKTDEAELAKIRGALLAYYPVPAVDLTVRSTPITVSGAIAGTDSRGWSNLLNQVMRERSTDQPGSDAYYFGLMQPAASMAAYCGRGCILGIAPQTTRVSAGSQVGLGASWADPQSYETIVHELGHAHGRGHAPCVKGGSIEGVDRQFPDSMGSIVDWGWDSRVDKLLAPTTFKDVMGYCSPNWVSPYTYSALAARSKAVNKLAFIHSPLAATPWHNVMLYSDGTSRWGGAVGSDTPGGDFETAAVLDATGATVAQIDVVRMALSHSDDQFLYIPQPEASWSAIKLQDRVLQLAQIQPELAL